MSKNFSMVLNVVLLIAVAFLYYAHYSSQPSAATGTDTDVVVNPVDTAAGDSTANNLPDTLVRPDAVGPISGAKVAYVNIDQILAGYELVTDLNASLLTEQTNAEARVKKKYADLEREYVEMEKQAKYWTQQQLAEGQQKLQKMQLDLQKYEQRLTQELMVLEQDHQSILLRNVKEYLTSLSQERGYDYVITYAEVGSPVLYTNPAYDITQEVLFQLNTEYRASKGN